MARQPPWPISEWQVWIQACDGIFGLGNLGAGPILIVLNRNGEMLFRDLLAVAD
jgi:hypothetical protein